MRQRREEPRPIKTVQIFLDSYMSAERLREKLDEAERDLANVTLDWDLEWDYGDQRAVVYLQGKRPMTDDEWATERFERAALVREAEERERAQYERLKERFEGGAPS